MGLNIRNLVESLNIVKDTFSDLIRDPNFIY